MSSTMWVPMKITGEEKKFKGKTFACCVSNNFIVLGLYDIAIGNITKPLYSLNAEFSTLKFKE